MKLVRVKLSALRNEEWFQYQTELLTLLKNNPEVKAGMGVLYTDFSALYGQADQALQVLRKSAWTAEIEALDQARDRLLTGLSEAVDALLHGFDASKEFPARQVRVTLDKYGRIQGDTYNQETAAIYNLLQDLKGPQAAEVSTLGLGGWVTAIEKANKEFETGFTRRTQESVAQSPYGIKPVRTQTDRNVREMFDRVDAFALTAAKPEPYDAFITQMNGFSDYYKRLLAAREATNAHKAATDGAAGV
jgi:hypothetical protein